MEELDRLERDSGVVVSAVCAVTLDLDLRQRAAAAQSQSPQQQRGSGEADMKAAAGLPQQEEQRVILCLMIS